MLYGSSTLVLFYKFAPNHSYTKIGHDESLAIAVDGSLLLDELDLVIQAALDGAGLAWVAEDRVTEHLASGALVRVLEDWCPPFPGFFVYYPSRRQQPAALAALIETLRV